MSDTPQTQLTYGGERFGTAVCCMDGRCLDAIGYVLKGRFGVHHIDTVTEPGMAGNLSSRQESTLASVKRCLEISVNLHGSRWVAVVGHHDCAGNPVSREVQYEQVKEGCRIIAEWGFPIEIIGLYINELWQAEPVCNM